MSATATASELYASNYQLPTSTGVRSSLVRSFAYCVAGTMGFVSPQALERSYSTSLAPVYYGMGDYGPAVHDSVELERTPAQDLARVRGVLRPTMLELANLFGVSRQAVYDWQGGAQPAAHAAEGLAKLASVADVFADANVAVETKTLRRKVAGGMTLLDAVRNGGDAEQLARSLLPTLQREAVQRARFSQQFASRKRKPVDADDYGTPALPEEARRREL